MNKEREEVIIVGAGPIGLACAISARRRGIDPLIIDAGALVNSVVHYPPQMVFFTTPELLEIGDHPFPCSGEKPTRAEALKYYRGVTRAEGLRVRTYTKLEGAERVGDGIRCDLRGDRRESSVLCNRLVLATGYFDHPNRLGVPGEDLSHVKCRYDEGHLSYNRDVVVVGGKNSALEAALDLFRSGARVTLVYRGGSWPKGVKYWVRPDVENRIRAGEIDAFMNTEVARFEPDAAVVRTAGGDERTLKADRVYCLIGYRPDQDLFRRIGISLDEKDGKPDLDPETYETNVRGVYMAGSITRGDKVSQVFIENGRFDGEKIFGGLDGAADRALRGGGHQP